MKRRLQLAAALADAENATGPSGSAMATVEDTLRGVRTHLEGRADVEAALNRLREVRARLDRAERVARRIDAIPAERLVSLLTADVVNLLHPGRAGLDHPARRPHLERYVGRAGPAPGHPRTLPRLAGRGRGDRVRQGAQLRGAPRSPQRCADLAGHQCTGMP
jgi:hypothetical protein